MKPLAERLRPSIIEDFVGQQHLLGENAPFRQCLLSDNMPSEILWGPPGVGKTSLAKIIAKYQKRPFFQLSAVSDGVKELRQITNRYQLLSSSDTINNVAPIIFIDEIHRFTKSQQASLLNCVENGEITLVGATTENPSFEIISPLLSRCQVFVLNQLSDEELKILLEKAIRKDNLLSSLQVDLKETEALINFSGNDARKSLNNFEFIINSLVVNKCPLIITNTVVSRILQKNPLLYDKNGDYHYDLISAFIKSIRGTDPDAAIYWLARMIEAGEEPTFIARRLIISAAEDIGLANPNALLIANAAFESVQKIGMPEGRIPLSIATIYLATAKKSNSAYQALNNAQEEIQKSGNLPVPLHLRNAPTKLMKNLNYGTNYKYPHDFDNNYVIQQYLPDAVEGKKFWTPQNNKAEIKIQEWLNCLKQNGNSDNEK